MRTIGLFLLVTCLLGCGHRKDEEPLSLPSYGPPAPLVDQMGDCPVPEEAWTWQPGYYVWTGQRYVWTSGKWVRRPAPEARWQPSRWLPVTYGWSFVPGYWN